LLQLPGASISDPTSEIATTTYDPYNDVVASVDPNGIANVTDFNSLGQPRQSASGVQPLAGHSLPSSPAASGTDVCGTSGITCTALSETHPSSGLQSDIWQDFGPFAVGTRLTVSSSVSTSGSGPGGAVLVVEDSPVYSANATGQRSAPLQTAAAKTVSVPFVVDQSRYVRVLLWQENFFGTSTWSAPVLMSIDPAPDTTLEPPATAYSTDFEQKLDRDAWTPNTSFLQDATNAHGGQWSAHESLASSSGDTHFYRSLTVLPSSDYLLTAWVRTVASGSQGGPGGASLVVTTAETGGTTIATSSVLQTEGHWQQVPQFIFNSGSNTSVNLRLDLGNFRGDAYFDDVSLVNLSDTQGAMNWSESSTLTGVTVHTFATGGLAGGGSRQVSMPSSTLVTDVKDALPTTLLRSGATYVISVWASTSLTSGSIDFSLRDGNKNVIPMGLSGTCAITNALTLCQNYATWTGQDGSGYLLLQYGGSTTARTITIAHPLIALASQKKDYTTKGQPSKVYDVFGRSTSNTYDTNGLYVTQTVVTATPSPNLTTNFTNNSIGQVILTTRVNGGTTIAEQTWRDSWGRVVGEVQNCVNAAAPPTRCTATASSTVNVLTRYSYDLNGNLIDTFTQGTSSGTWVDAHNDYDADGNQLDRVANFVAGQGETASQNVTIRSTYDVMGDLTDMASPAATEGGSTDTHTIYDTSRRAAVSIANYVVGGGSDSQTNVTTTTVYDADGRATTTWSPMGAGQVPSVTTYDALGRPVRQVVGSAAPPSGFTPATAQTDWTLDAGGRVTDELGPGTGISGTRYDTHYDLDALGRKLKVTEAYQCPNSCASATTSYVYDPRGASVVTSPPTQQLLGGSAGRTTYDLAGHVLSTIEDWQSGVTPGPDVNVTTSITYDGFGRAITKTDPRGIVTQTTYDPLDRQASVEVDPSVLKLIWTYTYSLAGDRIQVISPRNTTNRTDQTVYDALHRPITLYLNCVNCLTNGTHDFQTNVETDTTYDGMGRTLTVTDALGRVTKTDYDHLGRDVDQILNYSPSCMATPTFDQCVETSSVVDSSGQTLAELSPRTGGTNTPPIHLTTGYTYDALGRLATVTEDQGSAFYGHFNLVTRYGYDPSGNVLSMTDPSLQPVNYTYNQFNEKTAVIDALGNTVQTNYDLAGEITSVVDARGLTNSFTLDRLGRVVTTAYVKADRSTTGILSAGYDADGNQTSFASSDVASTTVIYDNANRVSKVSAPKITTTYVYFLDGAVNTVTDNIGGTNYLTTFTEDKLGRLASTADPLSGHTTTYTVDALGRLTQRVEASGVKTVASYSGIDELNTKTESTSGGVQFASWVNTFDPAGNRTGETSTVPSDTFAGVYTFGYDTVGRLSSTTQPTQTLTYGYDPASNRNSVSGGSAPQGCTSFTYQLNNAISTETPCGQSTISYAPDQDGNITADAAGHNLHFDSLNRLESAYDSSNTILLASYTYDALGRLATRTDTSGTVSFIYRGLTGEVVRTLSGTTVTGNYAWDTRGRPLLVQLSGTTYTLLTDPHGDLVGLANASGTTQGWIHFDAWGQVLGSGGTQIPFGYQGGFTDLLTLDVRMGVRWYDPRQGRFVSSDPAAGSAALTSPLQRERWLYAIDSPLVYSDPTGMYLLCDEDTACFYKETQAAPTGSNTQQNPPASPAPPYHSSGHDDWYNDPPTDCDQACVDAAIAKSQQILAQQAAAKAKQKTCDWWDAVCKAKQAWNATTKAVGDAVNFCKSSDVCKTVVTIGVGVAVFAGCEALTAGVGSLGCAVAAGAVSGAVSGALDCKSGQSMAGCVATGAAIGAVEGLVGGVAGKVVAAVGGRIAGAVISRLASRLESSEGGVVRDLTEATCNSFSAGTLVLMADGSKKPIQDVQIGDLVMAADAVIGIEGGEPVYNVIVGHGLKHLYDISVDGEVIEATYNHPFWVVEKQTFVWAEDLVPGEHLLLADGRAPPITAISHHDRITTVYNLSVTDAHTYFVGHSAILVHNAGGQCPIGIALKAYAEGAGHHIPAKAAFQGVKGYDLKQALAIPKAELDRLNISHAVVTGAQARLYSAFSKTGATLAWDDMQRIETEALATQVDRGAAEDVVSRSIAALRGSGVEGPARIPWGV